MQSADRQSRPPDPYATVAGPLRRRTNTPQFMGGCAENDTARLAPFARSTSMRKTLLAALLATPLLASAATNVLVNGDFESQPFWGRGISGNAGYTALTGSQMPGWTIEANHAVTIHNTASYPTISGGYSVNMDGEGHFGNNGNFFQDFASGSGRTYALDYDWLTWFASNARLDVSIVDLTTSSVLYSGNHAFAGGLHHEAASFVGTGNQLRLRVQYAPQSGYNDNTFMVDNFSITAAPVPEPTSLALLLGGLGVVGLIARRRRA